MHKFSLILLFLCLCFSGKANDVYSTDDNVNTVHKPITITVRLPEPGIYAVSVVDRDIVNEDTVQPNIVSTMLDNSSLVKSIQENKTTNENTKEHFGFETEQAISGKVKRAFIKIKNPQIITFNPVTGERQTYSLGNNQSFNLTGFDIQEGGRLTLQATKQNGNYNLVELQINEPYFPNLQINTFLHDRDTLSLPAVKEAELTETHNKQLEIKKKNGDFGEIELQEITVTGNTIKPLNPFKLTPMRGFTYLDDVLAKSYSMELVIARLGLFTSYKNHQKCPGLFRPVQRGWASRIEFVVPTVYIDDVPIDTADYSEMEELWNLNPQDIKQIEYFTEDQNEAKWTLKSNEAGTICIYTRTGNTNRNSLSMKNIRPLGYRPSVDSYDPLKDANYIADDDRRVTLLWNPELAVDSTCKAKITFMPSATSKHITVNLEGIGNNGAVSCNRGIIGNIPTLSDNEEYQITEYLKNTAREKAYIQTDRSQYCTGDTIWLRVHLADALTIIPSTSPEYPSDRSKFVYVEIHNNDGIIQEKKKQATETLMERIMIKRDEQGVFASYIVIPKGLTSSNLTLVAYTRHMLNFTEDHLPHKQIQVVSVKE